MLKDDLKEMMENAEESLTAIVALEGDCLVLDLNLDGEDIGEITVPLENFPVPYSVLKRAYLDLLTNTGCEHIEHLKITEKLGAI
jgi:hypothetical protein